MIVLVPSWAHHYDEFWSAIRARNLWFIKLRYAFACALALFFAGGELLIDFRLSIRQIIAITSLCIIIFLYNIFIQYIRKNIGSIPGKFNCLHLSLLQMILDLLALLILIYYTGIIDSPLYLIGIFQPIIGSLILPGYVVYTTSGIFIVAFSSMILLQHFGVLHSHLIAGLYISPVEHTLTYIALFILLYSTMILMSVYIANQIAHQLYKREQQLKGSLEQIEKVEEKKQKYIIGVVHEIKTPISAIQSFTNVLLHEYVGPLPEKIKEKIERIKIRSNDALNLVNNVLYISRLKLLNLTSSEEIEIVKIIESVLEQNSSDLQSKKMNILLNDHRDNKKLLKVDKILFELAVSNIISNSFKYTESGGTIQIDIFNNKSTITIEISDSGIGIPENEIQNVTHEFYRATNVKKSNLEGSGLGLALVKEVIERHNGEILIKSPSKIGSINNPGTSILIKLPLF